jgi:4-carboxymuconolactone decarboxylase
MSWRVLMANMGICFAAASTHAADSSPQRGVLSGDLQAREAQILGQPPRIAPLKPEELSQEGRDIVLTMRKALSLPLEGEIAEYHATLLRHPQLYRRHSELAIQLFRGALTPRQRELAILRLGWLCKAPYEWGEHVALGKSAAKLNSEEIERVTRGSGAPGWNDEDRAVIRAMEELHADAFISDATWSALARFMNEEQLLELPILAGQYQGLAYFLNSLRARLKPSNPGLSAR